MTGRLVDGQGNPIAGATLEVLQQVSGSASVAVIGHASTSANGTFTASVPGGPTRTIEIAYRAFSTDESYAAVANDRRGGRRRREAHREPSQDRL